MSSESHKSPARETDLDLIESQAAAWLSRRDRGLTPEEAVEFVCWRTADPRHEAAVEDLSAMWTALDDLSELQGKVVSEPPAPPVEAAAPGRAPRWNWQPWLAAAAACIAVLVGGSALLRQTADPVPATRYETMVGVQREVNLPDGSSLRLNTDSIVDVSYEARERRVTLVRGEARFAVAKDASRPFIVTANGIEARALGTAFIVRRREKETELVVTEGRVKFSAAAEPARAVEVGAGQSVRGDPLVASPWKVESLDQAALARRVAWESGRVVCRPGMPLAEVIAEFNRYHRQQLVLKDAATGAVTVGGAYELTKLEPFVVTLATSFDIVVVERDPAHIELRLKQ
jgi:transmembrane sensor